MLRNAIPRSAFLLAAFAVASASSAQQASPAGSGIALDRAVRLSLAALKPHQRSLVSGTARENLFMLLPEWGSDIQEALGLTPGNAALASQLCGKPCSAEEATLLVMQVAHERLASQPRPSAQ